MDDKDLISKGLQPVANISDKELEFLIQREFPDKTVEIRKELNRIKSYSAEGKNRIAAAVLKLAGGDFSLIRYLVFRSNQDSRDIIAEAEYPRSFSFGYGERDDEESKSDYLEDWEEYTAWRKGK